MAAIRALWALTEDAMRGAYAGQLHGNINGTGIGQPGAVQMEWEVWRGLAVVPTAKGAMRQGVVTLDLGQRRSLGPGLWWGRHACLPSNADMDACATGVGPVESPR
jgi:hypothetical protein